MRRLALVLIVLLVAGVTRADNPCTAPVFQVYPQFKIYDCSGGSKATFEISSSEWFKQWYLDFSYNDAIAQEIADSVYAYTLRKLDYYAPDPPH